MAKKDDQLDQTLQKAIRAARRGYTEPARKLLAQVLQADPNNEEAWLWMARSTDIPAQRAECLQRVLAINPDNRWAAEQLAGLQAPAAAAPQTPAPAAGELSTPFTPSEIKLEQLKCPKCGGALEPRSGPKARVMVCQYCRSVLELSERQADVIGQAGRTKPSQPIGLGMQATLDGVKHQVIGWLRCEGWDDEDRWRWDEWLLASSQGEFLWLSYDDEEGFVLQKKITPTRAFDPLRAYSIPVPGGDAKVTERAHARIVALDGELTWKANAGEHFSYLDARRGDMRYSVEYGADSIEVFEGRAIPETQVWEAFGQKKLVAQARKKADTKGLYFLIAVVCIGLALISFMGAIASTFTGQKLFSQELLLSKAAGEQTIGLFTVSEPNRVHKVALKAGPLQTNTWAVVDVEASDSEDNEFYLFAAEFWDEAGTDSDGPWHESDLNEDSLFRPDRPGSYWLTLTLDPESLVDSVQLKVSVEGGLWLGTYFVVFAVICAGLGYAFYCLSAGRLVGESFVEAVAEAMDD